MCELNRTEPATEKQKNKKEKRITRINETERIQGRSGPDAKAGRLMVPLQGQRKMCRIFNASLYPLCMLTIQLPSDMPTGPPPTIRVALWTKHPTDDSSPGKQSRHIQNTSLHLM